MGWSAHTGFPKRRCHLELNWSYLLVPCPRPLLVLDVAGEDRSPRSSVPCAVSAFLPRRLWLPPSPRLWLRPLSLPCPRVEFSHWSPADSCGEVPGSKVVGAGCRFAGVRFCEMPWGEPLRFTAFDPEAFPKTAPLSFDRAPGDWEDACSWSDTVGCFVPRLLVREVGEDAFLILAFMNCLWVFRSEEPMLENLPVLLDFRGLTAVDFGDDKTVLFPNEYNFRDVGEDKTEPGDTTFPFISESEFGHRFVIWGKYGWSCSLKDVFGLYVCFCFLSGDGLWSFSTLSLSTNPSSALAVTALLRCVEPVLCGVTQVLSKALEASVLFGMKLVFVTVALDFVCGKLLPRKPLPSMQSALFFCALPGPWFLLGVRMLNSSSEALPLAESFIPCLKNFHPEAEGLWVLAEEEPSGCFFTEPWSVSKSLLLFQEYVAVGLLELVVLVVPLVLVAPLVLLLVFLSSSHRRPMKSWQQI